MHSCEVVGAMGYVMNKKRKLGKPSKEYYNIIKKSYERLGFDIEILKNKQINCLFFNTRR